MLSGVVLLCCDLLRTAYALLAHAWLAHARLAVLCVDLFDGVDGERRETPLSKCSGS